MFITYDEDKENYNTYVKSVDLSELKNYISPKLYVDFDNLDNETKDIYLFNASKLIDNEYIYLGEKLVQTQPLKFPRVGLTDNEIIPLNVKIACIFRAIKYMQEVNNMDNKNIKKDKIGRTLEREYFNINEIDITKNKDIISNMIEIYLSPYITNILNICRG
jgi:hypothetical protein